MREEISLRAYGKINLGLDVTGKRPDGYHEVRMIMQTVSLYDSVRIGTRRAPGIGIRTNLPFLPTGPDNLVYRAARLLMDEFQIEEGLSIHLYKKIPVSAGMAGGSSDAAAVLVGVNRIFGLGLSKRELMKRGVSLGADIPYCIMRGTALAEGIGERLTSLPPMPECVILLAKPPVSISTKFVYGNLKVESLPFHPDIDRMMDCLEKQDLDGICSRMENVLETVTIPVCPQIQTIKERMREAGAEVALMSGSGPTVFGIFKERSAADEAGDRIRTEGLARQIYTVRPFQVDGRGRR
ncbi:MAG: 4-(cytidine 5'-diphospho)-2-C-methyl-D-erythritol kinase [Lachnospiraceae bacterium]|nr:4-(cytidine 5'-diphospho)-2-C-methyl-D-erythritol kinase [Lachnospiraceae bacterium]